MSYFKDAETAANESLDHDVLRPLSHITSAWEM